MHKFLFLSILYLLGICHNGIGQNSFNYELSLVPVVVTNLPGLHSYAFAQSEGKWLIIGGRKDGLHARQPFNSFPEVYNNTDIYVVDVTNNQFWSASVDNLPTSIKEQLQSTNMNFHQDGDSLYLIGGYGFSNSSDDHITYPNLTSVKVSGLIAAIQNAQPINSFFKQIEDSVFAVTGGHLEKLNDFFYLVGGHRFDGSYNPMGNPTYDQAYTNQIRKFTIDNSGVQLSISNYSAITDPVHLRRRDYNLLPQIFPNGDQGFTISSGVFQINADLPFLYPVDITAIGYEPITSFNQYLSNYHSAVACLYDAKANQMHSLFFGGMSQYHYQNETLIQDDLVPFVKTISRVTRDANGNLTEYQLPIEMPALKGSSAEFIANLNLSHYSNEVFKLNDFTQNSIMIGHIYGGILSPSSNPFTNNQTNTTLADTTIYEVWLTTNSLSANEFEIDGKNPFEVFLHPNPFESEFSVTFHAPQKTKVNWIIINSLGKIIQNSEPDLFPAGKSTFQVTLDKEQKTELLFLNVIFDDKYYVTKKLISN